MLLYVVAFDLSEPVKHLNFSVVRIISALFNLDLVTEDVIKVLMRSDNR